MIKNALLIHAFLVPLLAIIGQDKAAGSGQSIAGVELPKEFRSETYKCYQYKHYMLTFDPNEPYSMGKTLYIREYDKRLPLSALCTRHGTSLFSIQYLRGGENFLGLKDDFIFIDSSYDHELLIYDIKKRISIYKGWYAKPISITSNRAIFWQKTFSANKEICPQYEELAMNGRGAPMIQRKISFNLETLEITDLKETQCGQ